VESGLNRESGDRLLKEGYMPHDDSQSKGKQLRQNFRRKANPKRMPKYTKFGTKAGPRQGFKEWFGTKIAAGLSGTEVANRMRMIKEGKGKSLPKKGFGGMPMPKGTSEDKYGESLDKSLRRKQKSDRSGRRSKDLLYPGP
jgi:hypothetical protein